MGVGDTAEQKHRIEVDVGVQPRKREDGENRRGEPCRGRGRLNLHGPFGSRARDVIARVVHSQCARGTPRAPGSEEAVTHEEGRARPPHGGHQPWQCSQCEPDTRDAEHDEDGVGCGAHHDNRQYVLAPDSLSKHEQVLCADGHDVR